MHYLLLLSIISPIICLSSVSTDLSCKKNYHNWLLYTNQTLVCWAESKILFYPTFTCHPLHSHSPCKDSRLVFSNSACAETVCRAYKDNTDSPCRYPSVSHNGECADPGAAAACGFILGRRLVPDVFGDYSCKCDWGIGFVEYSGSCHAEYLEGPCKKGEQIVAKKKGTNCVKNTCPGEEVLFSDGQCYSYLVLTNALPSKLTTEEIAFIDDQLSLTDVPVSLRTFTKLPSKLTEEEIAFIETQLPESATALTLTFTNCAKRDSKGNCLEKMALPVMKEQDDEDFLILRSELFLEIDNDIN